MKRALIVIVAAIVVVVASAELETLPELAARLPDPMRNTFLRIALWQWLGLIGLAIVCALAAIVIRYLFKRLTYLRDRFAVAPMTEPTRVLMSKATGLLAGTMLAEALLPDLELYPRLANDIGIIVSGLALFAGILIVYAWWDSVCDSIAERAQGHRRAERLLIPMTRKLVRALIIVLGILIGLASYFGTKTIGGLAAGLGVGGLVLALAAKDSVENVVASITILFDMPFALGDWIRMDKVEGTVEEINLRSTRVRTADDTVITLPNANLIRNPVENFGAKRFSRQQLAVRLSYDCEPKDIDAYCRALHKYLEEQPRVQKGKTMVELDDPRESSVGVVALWFLEGPDPMADAASRHAFLDEAIALRKKHAITFARPIPLP